MKFQRLLVASLLSLPASGFAASSTATATLQVSASVDQACTITAAPLSFGTYDPKATVATDIDGSLKVICTKGTPYTISMNAGMNGIDGVRTMTASSGSTSGLTYEIYKDSNRSTVWGMNTTGQSNTGTGADQSIYLYGRIEKNQWVAAGNYKDTVTVTLSLDGVN